MRFWVAFAASPPPAAEIEATPRGRLPRARRARARAWAIAPFLVGGRYTIADIALYGYTHVAAEGGFDMAGYPAIARLARARRGPAGPRADHGVRSASRPSRAAFGSLREARVAAQPGHFRVTA